MLYITRRETFNAAHRLYRSDWSVEKNFEVFGPCSQLHGHNWELFVTVGGHVNPETGFVMDLKTLSQITRQEIVDKVDHRYLNTDVPFLAGVLPSTENFILAIWGILQPVLAEQYGIQLYKLKLVETANHFVEYMGELHQE
jgi:6-pyruvoyltetrahydropterin/6-carboxytetrahydropterin synthase